MPDRRPVRVSAEEADPQQTVKIYHRWYNGTSEAAFLEAMGPGQTPQQVADALLGLIKDAPAGGNFVVSLDGVAALT
jgi:hypothetical protein